MRGVVHIVIKKKKKSLLFSNLGTSSFKASLGFNHESNITRIIAQYFFKHIVRGAKGAIACLSNPFDENLKEIFLKVDVYDLVFFTSSLSSVR